MNCTIYPTRNQGLNEMQFLGKVHLILQGGDEDIEGSCENFSTPEMGALKKLGGGLRKLVYFKTNRGGGLLKN